MGSINLFCLPFAGGNRHCYRLLQASMPSYVRMVTLEYPGRGGRSGEPLAAEMDRLIDDLFEQIREGVMGGVYAIFGHSMGGLAACLLARRIVAESLPAPVHLFITGTSGPSAFSREEKKRHLLSKKDLVDELKKLNGSPREVLENEVLLDYFEPIIRADFRVSENFSYRMEEPMRIPLTVITGKEEEMTLEEIGTWQQETCVPVDFIRMPGGHFFLLDQPGPVIDIMSGKLSSYLNVFIK